MEVTVSLSLHCRLDFKTEAEPGFISGRLINSAKQFFTKQEKKYLDNEMLECDGEKNKKNDYSSKTTDNGTRSGYLPQN